MSPQRVVFCLVVVSVLAFGERHKVTIDPETKEGYVLQQIQQERDPVQKIKFMNDFVVEFPKSESLAWVYEQLLPVYLNAKDYDKVIAIGSKMLELDPDDLDSAHSILQSAEALKDPNLILQYAGTCWKIAGRVAKSGTYSKPEYALQMLAYSEYTIAALANNEPDNKKRADYLKVLEGINPKSQWVKATRGDFFTLQSQGASKERLAVEAENTLKTNPDNEDMLMLVADYHMGRGDNPDKVLDYCSRALEILRTKKVTDKALEAEFEKKKEHYIGAANYMIGILSSIQGRYSQADKSLRAALPIIRNTNDKVLGAVLYHLGFSNYQLAERGERGRVFEAIKFNEQCAMIHSNYREQALKNVEAIKAEYNLR